MTYMRIHFAALAVAGLLVGSMPAFAMDASPYGTPLNDGKPVHHARSVDRTIIIDANTKHINVTGGETVRFVVGDSSFEWLFDTYATSPVFDLKAIAPDGVLDHQSVKVYVSPDPLYAS